MKSFIVNVVIYNKYCLSIVANFVFFNPQAIVLALLKGWAPNTFCIMLVDGMEGGSVHNFDNF